MISASPSARVLRGDVVGDDNSLGELLERLDEADRAGETTRCIELCRRALDALDRPNAPELWAALNGVLADKLVAERGGDRAANEEEAITHYLQALEVFRETDRVQWAKNQGSLGNLYAERVSGDPDENRERSIHHYEQALEGFRRDQSPVDWAATHQNLGEAYHGRSRGGPQENREQVIYHFERALEVFTREERPGFWRTAKFVLGDAYGERAREGGEGDRARAEGHYTDALATVPEDRRQARGLLHEKLARLFMEVAGANVDADREQAIEHFEAALAAYRDVDLDGAVRAHSHLGYLYSHREHGPPADNVRRAISHLEAILELRSPDRHPEEVAQVSAALGMLYADPSLDDG